MRCAKSRLFLAQAETHFPHSDPPPVTICKCESGSMRCIKKNFGQPISIFGTRKSRNARFHSFELIMHASVGGGFSGVFLGQTP